ncbi:MAG TPA: ABC transporter substrate-binding protein [Aliidongia sp.]|uniref:ABC transporter substrate-binding protein n=1 Tax=Aliidongia sp. TaxID=1914230 RepID=UPI002DDCEFCF|nr:ABC transporter substrate-binding protein [Aliidongia sp.]HEV2674989.1 ABC transporter substrate-binding protein [Aliidongia sp.]
MQVIGFKRCLSAMVLAGVAAIGTARAQSVTVALNADIRSTNPGVNRDDNTDGVVLNMVEGLVGYRQDGTVGPLLAEKVDTSADGLTYTFHLRKGVRFHNGAPMTSADVLWSWQRYMDAKTEWRCLADFDGRSGLKVVEATAPDADTFVMKIDKPSALFLDSLSRTDCGMTGILSKDSVNPDGTWNRPIGTGPFKFVEWKRGEYVTVTRFDDYVSPPGDKVDGYVGNKKAFVKDVKFLVVPDASTAKAGLLSGAIDIAQILDSDAPELQQSDKVQVLTPTSAVKHVLLIQTRDPILKTVKLRQAIAAALDMGQLVAAASNGLGKINNAAVPSSSAYSDAAQKKGYAYDPAKARQLLAESGYKGEPIKIIANKRLTVPSFPVAVMAQAMLQAVGINVEIEVLEWATQLDRYNKGNYQMMSFSYSSRLDPALSYEQFTGPKDKQPRKVWDNPDAQALLDKASTISDQAERQKLFDQLYAMQLADTPLIILFNGIEFSAQGKRVQGEPYWEGKQRLWGVTVAN